MDGLEIPDGVPTNAALNDLQHRCELAFKELKYKDSEVRLPLFIEFAGSPKSGKTTVIGIIAHFLKRTGIDVLQPAEGASLRTPPSLRDDWLAFNAWTGMYALQEILVEVSRDPPTDIVLMDRGLFDVSGWMEFLCSSMKRISDADRDGIVRFFSMDLWRRRVNAVFLFTADYKTSLKRETDNKLTTRAGSVMNAETLELLNQAYKKVATSSQHKFENVYHIDTSLRRGKSPSFQQIAFVVADEVVKLMETLGTQVLLVTNPVEFNGFEVGKDTVGQTVAQILSGNKPRFLSRDEAERTLKVQQVVPYALLEREGDRFFWAKRRSDLHRKQLRGKHTLLVGGHAEQRDWDPSAPEKVFERCLRRELEEELVDIEILNIEPLGFINDTRNSMGSHHLAYIHRVRVGGRTMIRRQAIDQEFGRGSVDWKSRDEIKSAVADLDPWSQLVAKELFGAEVPASDGDPTLFN